MTLLSETLKEKVSKREMLKTVEIEELIPQIELLEIELNDYKKGADELLDKAEKWDGYLSIIGTMDKTALEMGLHLTTDPLELPKDYLKTSIEYINDFASKIGLNNTISEVRKLPKRWRKKAAGPIPSDRAIGLNDCADELDKTVKRTDRRLKENRGK